MKRKTDNNLENKKKQKRKFAVQDDDESLKAEFLDIQTLREGMLLLGTVIEIRSNYFLMSLPGCLVGTVPVTNISNKYTEILKNCSEDGASEEVPLQSMLNLGATLPCKVLQVKQHESKKPTIILSIDPETVNSSLKNSSLYTKMVLFTAVKSIEDHGYVMETGISGLKGFLPFENTKSNELLHLGQVIPTCINKLPNQKDTGNVISLIHLSYEDSFPVVSNDDIKITSLLPGAVVNAYVSEISDSFLYLKCLNFEACSSALTSHRNLKKIKESTEVSGTLLYVHPVTNVLYVHLGPLPTPSTYGSFFETQKFDEIKNVKFVCSLQNKLFFKFGKRIGYVKSGEVSKRSSFSQVSLKKNPVIPKARVVFLHYMDNLMQLTFKDAFLKMKIVKPEDVKVGDIYEATVKRHVEDGMFVSVCPGLSGFVRYIFLSDSYVTKPENLHKVGSQVKCRVLSQNLNSGLTLTCKESLIALPNTSLLDSYEKAIKGKAFKGVIVKKTDEYIIVLFFNNVQGIVSSENIPKVSIFYVGQTVNCIVVFCNPVKKKLKLSLNPETLSLEAPECKHSKKQKVVKQISSHEVNNGMKLPVSENDLSTSNFSEGKPYKAIIKKITAHQMNIIVSGKAKGRIHITQTGCTNEDECPLKNFVVGQHVKVYVLKSYEQVSRNYLSVSHQNFTSFLECSLIYPPCISCEDSFNCCEPRIGFLKEVCDTTAFVWLSPYHVGKLDFVNISENPKVLRKLKKKLKIGQSINVKAFNILKSSGESGEIKLVKPEISAPDTGRNVVGLLTLGSPDRNLVLKLPYDYTGYVHLTDIQDVYTALQPVIDKLLKLKFVLCHVLHADHKNKVCQLSLRKSRLYSEKYVENASPEMSMETLEPGKTVKGYIKSVLSSRIIVNIGRNVNGKIELHKCSKYGCMICLKVSEAQKTFAIGNVIEVVIESLIPQDGFISLSLPSISDICSEDTTLTVSADINWNEL